MNIWKRIQIKYARSPKKRAELIKKYGGGYLSEDIARYILMYHSAVNLTLFRLVIM